MSTKILFLDTNHLSSRIAVNLSRTYASEDDILLSAGIDPKPLDNNLLHFLNVREINVDAPVSVQTIGAQRIDLVVQVTRCVSNSCPILPGVPPVIRWDLEEPDSADISALESYIETLRNHVFDLYRHGSIPALVQQQTYLELILDSLHEGILVHGLDRRISLFSKGAEEITGVHRDQILGRDCHTLFKPHFCGDQCAFCDHAAPFSNMSRSSYPVLFTGSESSRKELEVTRIPLRDEHGSVIGAIATIVDATRVRELEMKLGEAQSFDGIIGQDSSMLEIFTLIKDLGTSDFPVVVTGESGTGKELVAAAIHKESNRRDRLFVPVNCGALPEGTLESELFGHVKGAFTGAIRDKKGRFELADKGTLFLDEIAELSQRMQVKLLRVLQEGTFEPVGSETQRKVDVRVICATNRNLKEMVSRGEFRDDLYYRLAVVPIELPPLRDRRNDIPLLARHFLAKTSHKLSRGEMAFSEETVSILMNYSWPGNIRQLQNTIQFALIKCRGTTILPEHLPPEVLNSTCIPLLTSRTPGKAGRKPKLTLNEVERALVRSGGNKAKAARFLGVGRATLYNFLNGHKELEAVAAS